MKHAPHFPRRVQTIPAGCILIHNDVRIRAPDQCFGEHGFDGWFDKPDTGYIPCNCGRRPDLGTHYTTRDPT
jgi:hypothetical protein